MTGFDLAIGAMVLASSLAGLVRGAIREITTLVAFIAAVVLAILLVRPLTPLAHHFVHALWLARVAALAAVFVITYIVVRLTGGHLTQGVRRTALSGLDRLFGLVIGFLRGVVVTGVLVLLIHAATPPERLPHWYTHAAIYPLAQAVGAETRALTPEGVGLARRVAPEVENALAPKDGASDENDTDETSR